MTNSMSRPIYLLRSKPVTPGVLPQEIAGIEMCRRWPVLLGVLVILGTPLLSPAQAPLASPEPVGGSPHFAMRHTALFSKGALIFGERRGYDTVRLQGCDYVKEAGRPMLPVRTARIALPAGMTVTSVRVTATEEVSLPGEYTVYPAQPPTPINGTGSMDWVVPDQRIYASREAYPDTTARFVYQTDLAGQSIAVVRLHPVRYMPAEHRLMLSTSITLLVEGVDGYQYGDYLPAQVSTHARRSYERMIREAVVNPDKVMLMEAPGALPASRGVEPGSYEYVIITQDAWVDDFQLLAEWRIKTGIPSRTVTTDWIYNNGGYAGSDLEKIRAFVEDAHQNWGATYFLLGGDTNVIPDHIRTITVPGYETAAIPNDTYYADYDEDWVCEVHVGRAPVRTTAAINTFVSKVFSYEKSPPLGDYVTTAAFFGFDITISGDQDGELAKENIRSLHLPPTWTINTEYDAELGTHKADVIGYLNQGHHLVNHHDHCNWNCMGTGWISHGELMYVSDVNGLSNGDRLSILFAVGCNPCDITTFTSIGEAFLQHPTGGGIAFMGNSRTGWGGPPEDPDHYSVRQDRFFYRNLLDDGFERLGANFSDLKNDEFSPDDPYNLHQYCFTQLHLLGDPELAVWSDEPQSLTVTHDATLPVGEYTTFPVEVYSGGNPVDGATVCLSKGFDVYEVEETVAGTATFGFTPDTVGTMSVTVTGHNYLPYEGNAVIQGDGTIPTVSEWGMIGMILLTLCVGTVVFSPRSRRSRPAALPHVRA